MKQLEFSRGDYAATKVLLVLAALLHPALTLLPRVLDLVAGRPLVVRGLAAGGPGPLLDEPTPGVVGRYTEEAVWTIAAPTARQWVVALLPETITSVLVVVGLVVVWRLVSTTQRGAPFDRKAVRRLRLLAVLVLAYGLLKTVGTPAVLLAVFWDVSSPSLGYELDLTTAFPFVIGFLVLVLSESFRVGLRLRDDVEGLV